MDYPRDVPSINRRSPPPQPPRVLGIRSPDGIGPMPRLFQEAGKYADDPAIRRNWAADLDSVCFAGKSVGDVVQGPQEEDDYVVLPMTDLGAATPGGSSFDPTGESACRSSSLGRPTNPCGFATRRSTPWKRIV